MLAKFGNLFQVLSFAYPDVFWEEDKFNTKSKKAAQRFLHRQVKVDFQGGYT
jgi:hypothetical protein